MKHPSQCPHCNVLLDLDDIYEYFLKEFKDEKKALETAGYYGWTKETPCCFSRVIGVYSMEYDRTTHYECPDCKQKIDRPKRKND